MSQAFFMLSSAKGVIQYHSYKLRNTLENARRTIQSFINYPEIDFSEISNYDFLPYEDIDQLPRMIANLYEEVIEAFESDSTILSGLGLRTLVEAICLNQSIARAILQNKIRGLFDKGLISSAELPILDKLRLIGNFSAHSIKACR